MSINYKGTDYRVYVNGQEIKFVDVELEYDSTENCYPFTTLEEYDVSLTGFLEFVYDLSEGYEGNTNRANRRKALNKRNQNREDTGFNKNKFRNRFK